MTNKSFEAPKELKASDAMSLDQLMELGKRATVGEELTPREQATLEQFPPEEYAWAVKGQEQTNA